MELVGSGIVEWTKRSRRAEAERDKEQHGFQDKTE
jgi:hypothetical protein